MKRILFIISFLFFFNFWVKAQTENKPDFTWGNTVYFNLNIGEGIHYNQHEIELLSIENQCNRIVVDKDTINVKTSRRSLPVTVGDLKIVVADNKTNFLNHEDLSIHGLLTKDALIGVSYIANQLLNVNDYVFPVSFNEGFIWNYDSENYPFSNIQTGNSANKFRVAGEIDFNLQNEKGEAKHWMLAIENCIVVLIKESDDNEERNRVNVLVESESQPGIYYYYGNLYRRNLEIKLGQQLRKGELIGTVSGDRNWGSAHFSVLKSDSVPDINKLRFNVINFFPQLFELYFKRSYSFSKLFSKGTIEFGKMNKVNEKNNLAFEDFSGKGWLLDCWSAFDKVPFVSMGEEGNVRLSKMIFAESNWKSENPENFYEYEINVNNGRYRIRVKIGDVELATWQKVEFENTYVGEFLLEKGIQDWTSERLIVVNDGKLTVRIYVAPDNSSAAGLGEIVFQRMQ